MFSTFELFLLVICLGSSAFFSLSEAVLLSINIDRARQIIEKGGTFGHAMDFMTTHGTELLTTILVGNNLANIYAAALTTNISTRLFGEEWVGYTAGVTTIVILMSGEIAPKTIGRSNAERLSYPVLIIMRALYYSMYPLITPVVWLVNRLLGSNAQLKGHVITKADLEYMVNRAEKEKTMDSKHIELLSSILEFPAIRVKDVMVPRAKLKYLQRSMSLVEVRAAIQKYHYSRYPVVDGDLEHVIGLLHVKDLSFLTDEQKQNFRLDRHLKSSFIVYEHMKINSVFDHMNRKKMHLAVVKDELGTVVGVISLEDIVEQIVGDIHDEHDEEIAAHSNHNLATGIVVPGTTTIRDLYTEYDVKLPIEDNYSTLAGFILDMLGNNFPEKGQLIFWEGFSFELVKVENHEIKEVRIKSVDDSKHLYSKKDVKEQEDPQSRKPSRDSTEDIKPDMTVSKSEIAPSRTPKKLNRVEGKKTSTNPVTLANLFKHWKEKRKERKGERKGRRKGTSTLGRKGTSTLVGVKV